MSPKARPCLIENCNAEKVIADKGYDSDAFIEAIQAKKAEPVIPPRSNQADAIECHFFQPILRPGVMAFNDPE